VEENLSAIKIGGNISTDISEVRIPLCLYTGLKALQILTLTVKYILSDNKRQVSSRRDSK